MVAAVFRNEKKKKRKKKRGKKIKKEQPGGDFNPLAALSLPVLYCSI